MKQNQYLLALICCAMMWGCSNDSSGTGSTVPEEQGEGTPECSQNDDCDSGKCLDSGKCAKLVKKGASCDEEHICKDKLECKDGVCTDASEQKPDPKPDEGKCSKDEDCDDGLICVQDKCTEVKKLQAGDECVSNDRTAVCPEGLGCYLGKCMTEEEFENADKCKSDDDCLEDVDHPTCLPSGLCGVIHPLGDGCGGNLDVCEEGFECYFGTCSTMVPEGEACSEDEHLICESGLECIEGYCRTVEKDLEKGSECNLTYKLCKEDFVCRDSVCVTEFAEDADCDDSVPNEVCAPGLACLKGKCTPFGDTCESTADCKEKDSFCCKSDECGMNGYCIPYDETTKFDNTCRYRTKPGIFESQVQCRWQSSLGADASNVEIPVLVGKFHSKIEAETETLVAFWSWSPYAITFMHPETCKTVEVVQTSMHSRWYNYPTAIDIDGDGFLEIVVVDNTGKPAMFKWDAAKQVHEKVWTGDSAGGSFLLSFDVDEDGTPEIIAGDTVYNSATGKQITKTTRNFSYNPEPAIGYLDGKVTLFVGDRVLNWDKANKAWTQVAKLAASRPAIAYADFGTPGDKPENFDFSKLDGRPEVISGGDSKLSIYTLIPDGKGTYSVQTVMDVQGFSGGGPLTVGDFDNDGFPEVAVAGTGTLGVYDPECKQYEAGKCADRYVRWERWSQDASSSMTGSTLFDFDGDGQTEVVYGDECFTRVYDGKTGKVLFSAKRTSGTAQEAPVVADIDNDGSAEIIMGSTRDEQSCYSDSNTRVNPQSGSVTAEQAVDPIHEGIYCMDDEDCPTSKNCRKETGKEIGLCTCTTNDDCNTQYVDKKILQQYVCTKPIHPDIGMFTNPSGAAKRSKVKELGARPDGWKDGDYKVCRATRKHNDIGYRDVVVYRDRLDRWVSSRNIWNQHGYNIININNDGKVPTAAQWLARFTENILVELADGKTETRRKYNSFRLNEQGLYGAGTVPDITGRFIAGSICGKTSDGRYVISGKLCNRGTKPVSTALPASFFYYDKNNPEDFSRRICTSYTKEILGVGECGHVGCEITEQELENLADKDVIMVTNMDENGFASTVECNSDNNTDIFHIDSCKTDDPIEIVN